jgi:potassium efflux system protein
VRQGALTLRTLSFACLVGAVALFPVAAQEAETQPTATQPVDGPARLTIEEARARLSRVESDADAPENARIEAANLYRQAVDQLTQAETWRQKADEFRRGRENVPGLLEEVKARVQRLTDQASSQPTGSADTATLEELSRELAAAEATLKDHQDLVRRVEDEARQRTERRQTIPDLMAAAGKRLEAASSTLTEVPGVGAAPVGQLARRTLVTAQRSATQEETRAYQEELQFYDARTEVLAMRRDEARTLAAQSEARVAALRPVVGLKREADAAQQREQAEAELRRAPEVIRALAKENNQFAKDWDELGPKIKAAEERKQTIEALDTSLKAKFDKLKTYSELPDMAGLVGSLMRQQRAELNRLRGHKHDLERTREDYARVLLIVDEITLENDRLVDLKRAVDEHLQDLLTTETELSRAELSERLEALLTARRDIIRKLDRDYDAYLTDLIELASAMTKLRTRVDQISAFIEAHVLWIRSAAPVYRMTLPVDESDGQRVVRVTAIAWWAEIREIWWSYGIAALLFAILLLRQPWFRSDLKTTSDLVGKPLTDQYRLTVQAVFHTAAIALPMPLLLWGAGWRVHRLDIPSEAVLFEPARAFVTTGTILFVLLFVRHSCRRFGLAACHFRWEAKGIVALRRHLLWLAPAVTPLVFIVIAAETNADPAVSASIGRVAFLVCLVVSLMFVRQVLHPDSGVFAWYYNKRSGALVSRIRWVEYIGALALLVGLGVASAIGYHYTAIELASAVVKTLILTLALVLLHAMAVRWVFFTQRQLAIQEARRKKAEQTAQQDEGAAAAPDVLLDESALNLGKIGEQTRQLLGSFAWLGVIVIFWFSWADLLPALTFLQDVELWSYVSEMPVVGESGATATTSAVQTITLANALVAVLVLIVAYVLARNTPGLLEIAILRRLPLDTATRFAICAVSRYVITVVGVTVAFASIGIGWTRVQWLLAAITVGLGFGLQEIFANFVSGLILLFERPIRIGDTVTVGGITGTVTRMRIRATTITDWDRKELIIPNKEFVTGQVVNWSLSDQVLRLTVKVGIAYGSDVPLAKKLLLKIAKENNRVMEQPPPQVWFWEFGDSSLNFEIRVFVPHIDDWIRARDSLHCEIDAAFRSAGIEIAFPQRDIHVRSIHQALAVDSNDPAASHRPVPQQVSTDVDTEA